VPRLHELLIKAEAMRVEDAAVFGPSWRNCIQSRNPLNPRRGGARAARTCLRSRAQARRVTSTTLASVRATRRRCVRKFRRGSLFTRSRRIANTGNPGEIVAQEFGLECVSPGELARADAAFSGAARKLLFTPNFAARENMRRRSPTVRSSLSTICSTRAVGRLYSPDVS